MNNKSILNGFKALFVNEKDFLQDSASFDFKRKIWTTLFIAFAWVLFLVLSDYIVFGAVWNKGIFWGLPFASWRYIYMSIVSTVLILLFCFYHKDSAFVFKVETILLAIVAIAMVLSFSYKLVLMGDEREHLTASFYIYKGQRPYLDFFEHHHPLLWYCFLPVIWLFHNTAYIWYIMRSFVLLLIVANMIAIYKITQMIAKNKKFSLLAVVLSLCPHVVYCAQITFRPDTLMSLMLLWGIYYILKYLKEKNNRSVYWAFICFFFAFMALQKALLFLFFIALWVLYLLYKKEIPFMLLVKSLIAPVVLLLMYLIYLYQTGALKDYWELNWLLNTKMHHPFIYIPIIQSIWFYLAAVLALCLFVTKQPMFLRYIAFLCVCFSVALFFAGTFVQYWIPLYSLFAIVVSYGVCQFKNEIRAVVLAGFIWFIMHNNIIFLETLYTSPLLRFFVEKTNLVLKNSTPDDLILGSPTNLGGLRMDAKGYYWFGLGYMAVIDHHYFNRHPLPKVNEVMKLKRPKIITLDQEDGCASEDLIMDRECKQKFEWNFEYLRENYMPLAYDLIIRRNYSEVPVYY